MKNSTKMSLAAGVGFALASSLASAAVVSIDVAGIESWDGFGDPDNTVLVVDLAAELGLASGSAVTVTGIGWDVSIDTVDPSWLSEAAVVFGGAISVAPGGGDDFPGSDSYSSGGLLDLTDNSLPNIHLTDGLLVLEFFEGYDDVADAVDAIWSAGTLTVNAAVPLPAALPLFATGLGGLLLGAVRRRRSI